MVHDKAKLLEIGGVMHGVVLKWNEKMSAVIRGVQSKP